MNTDTFLSYIQKNFDRIKKYVWGGDGSDGDCDCIGLVIGALDLYGVNWNGVHGTNYTVRNRMRNFHKITASQNDIKPGQLVFKSRAPGSPNYDLPSSYKNDPDKNDYYHVGVVTSVNPIVIKHCTPAPNGKLTDYKLGSWAYIGDLDAVSDGATPTEYETYKVVGGDLFVRSGPGTGNKKIGKLEEGSIVKGFKYNDDWNEIIYGGGSRGYCMSAYLESTDIPAKDTVILELDQALATELFAALKKGLGVV